MNTFCYSGGVKAFLNAAEVAKLLNVHRATVVRWIRKGMIRGAQRIPGTQNWRIPLSA
jgi:excisionase family DNA binding protein